MGVPADQRDLPRPAINLYCPQCKSAQTFTMSNHWGQESLEDHEVLVRRSRPTSFPAAAGGSATDTPGFLGKAIYTCSSCATQRKTFLLLFDDGLSWVMKAGEYPPWSIEIDKTVARFLGDNSELFRKGLICESHSFGIAAFTYYRRVIDCTIQTLLQDMLDLLPEEEKEAFSKLVAKAKARKSATEKLDLVKDAVPNILRPDGANPVRILYDVLSEGIHDRSDDECLALSARVREILTFLIGTIQQVRSSRTSFNEGLRQLKQSSR